ncbi:MAG: helix-turn-helix domain-containing protein [Vulcanimicrobiaceae bacterium]
MERLSASELQVARLAARGLSSREIALALGISVRTVENHLHAAYSKLSVCDRDELVAAIADFTTQTL